MKEKLLAGVELINKKLGEEPFLIELVRTNLSVTGDISYALAELWSLPEDFKAVRVEWGEFETKTSELVERNLQQNAEFKESLENSNAEFKTQTTQAAEEFKTAQTQRQEAYEADLTQKQNEFEAAQTQEQTLQNTRIGALEVALIDNVVKLKEQDESIRQELNNSQTQQNADFDGKIQNVKTEFEASQQTQNADFDGKIQNVKTEFDTKFVKKGELDAELDPYFKIQTHWWKFLRFGWGVPENDVRKMFCFNQDREGHEDKMVFQIGGAGLGFKEYNGKRYLATDNESDNHGKSYKLLEERDLRDDSLLGKEERGVKVKELNNGFLKTIKLGDTTLDETTLKHIIEVCNNIDGNLVP